MSTMTIGQCATLACLLEATIPKPGNVHRGADFEDLTFTDFVAAGVAVGPAMQRASEGAPLGATVLDAIRATRAVSGTNVNLGIVLLCAPIACAVKSSEAAQGSGAAPRSLRDGVRGVLSSLTPADCAAVYEAIALAMPGGMGKVEEGDVAGPPPSDLLHAMGLAAERDTIARQYVTGFAELFDFVVAELRAGLARGWSLHDSVIRTHLRTMQAIPDTLIARKCGAALAGEVAVNAGAVLNAGEPGDENYNEALADLDFYLRSDGHRRNPGTTADLIAAALFLGLVEGWIPLPLKA
jgi:triphosphoribosyl-dephospho-CoA synthase